MKDNAYALRDSGVLGLLAILTTYGILRSDRRAPEAKTAVKTKSLGWLDRFDAWLWRQEMHRRDEYLAQSSDIFELERRQRALERGLLTGTAN
jgi:hypothetical protein